jgi:hypothetical protein
LNLASAGYRKRFFALTDYYELVLRSIQIASADF